MNKTIGLLAHVDAGKTTFSEQILYHANSIKRRGRVDHKDAFLDNHAIEKKRGITVFADQGTFLYNQSKYFLIDTPGHVDFSPEMERSVQVMDYAIIIISAVEGVEGHTETVWRLLRRYNIPTFFFINKIDRTGANVQVVIDDIKENLTDNVCIITDNLKQGQMKDDLIEFLAEQNEELLEQYMSEKYSYEQWIEVMVAMIKQNKIFPCAYGSALQDSGITAFLDQLDQLTVTSYCQKGAFGGRVHKIRYDEKGTRLTFIKGIAGTLSVRDQLNFGEEDDDKKIEKVTQIREYNGNTYEEVSKVQAGELFAVTGLSLAEIGDGVGTLREKNAFDMVSTMKAKVIFEEKVNPKEVMGLFKLLDAEDPVLHVTWDEVQQDIHIHVMGKIQLEVLSEVVKERFNLNVTFGNPEIVYKETIQNTVIGYGHFEPLKHYAEAHLKLEPGASNSGISYENKCHVDELSVGNQNLVQQHVFERDHRGILTGSALTDVKITLLTGRAHNKHTSGGDFREATYRAIRQGLEKASNLLLEPNFNYKIMVHVDFMGKVLSDIQYASGSFEDPKTDGDKVIISGRVPVANFMSYGVELASLTQGKGSLTLSFAGYFACHNQEEVIKRIGYNKDKDATYSSSSIFCSKGQGYTVPWDQVEKELHCL